MVFDFEKMEVYSASLEALQAAVEVSDRVPRGQRQLADQLKRAASSICLNTAEGVGEFKALEKARFYRMALRSTSESCAVTQILHRLKIIDTHRYREIYNKFTKVAKLLTRLIASMNSRANSIVPLSRERERDGASGTGRQGRGAGE